MTDPRSDRRLAEDKPFDIEPVIPSAAPYPEAAQRDYRGYVILVIAVLVVSGIVLNFAIVSRLTARRIVYAPEAMKIGAGVARQATEWEVHQVLRMLVARMETYSPKTVSSIWNEVLPYMHPVRHQAMKDQYDALAKRAESLWQHRVGIPLGVASAGETKTGVRRYAVFYLVAELTGRDDKSRAFNDVRRKAAYVEVIQDTPSTDNPAGVVVQYFKGYDEEAWIKAGFPKMWDEFTKPDHKDKDKEKAKGTAK